jgi:TPR repeat protein
MPRSGLASGSHSRRGIVKRLTWTVVFLAAFALLGCGEAPEQAPVELVATPSGDEDAYQTTVYAQQRDQWEAQARQGDLKAQRQLGMMYYLGQGMDPDFDLAYEWLTKAADRGDNVGQLTLGVMYVEGQGVQSSNVQAHVWFSLSAQQGNESAEMRLERLVAEMSQEEIAEAEQLAEDWKPSA